MSWRTSASMLPMMSATLSMVGASMIEVLASASGASMASRRRAMVVWVTERLPAVRMTITRSPGFSKVNILR